MKLKLIGHSQAYALETLCLLFFPNERAEVGSDVKPLKEENCGIVRLAKTERHCTATAVLQIGGCRFYSRFSAKAGATEKELRNLLCRAFYMAAKKAVNIDTPWGILTGIRPAKLAWDVVRRGGGRSDVRRVFVREYLAKPQKADLCFDIVSAQKRVLDDLDERDISLYVSIPFCPTRCSYCSFVSHSVEKADKLIEPYLELLKAEIEETGRIVSQLGLRLRSLYIGGGTPTVLTAGQLGSLMKSLSDNLDFSSLAEYTVEAGRPDTITAEKLAAIKNGYASRVSVNPQTMHEEVLAEIGRKHSPNDVLEAYRLAREAGIPCINMDLIAGLPSDSLSGFCESLKSIIALQPENITVHALSIKRAARLAAEGAGDFGEKAAQTSKMLEFAEQALKEADYHPYYCYRQKKTMGNAENVGYSKSGFEGTYNIYMMEELHTVLAVGAGGVGKFVNQKSGLIKRIYNPKYPYEYLSRAEEILKSKQKITEFYKEI